MDYENSTSGRDEELQSIATEALQSWREEQEDTYSITYE